jgi:glucan phosphoethanolaminetransferase (alkaline phosphatase superfamily)
VNSYDNSVLYTDYFVSRVIESLKGTNSILFFAADHGVFLGEDGMQANGNSDDESDAVKKVPLFFYMTDSLKKDKFFRQKFSIAAKKTSLQNLSHDNLFDSLLDCSGVSSDLFKRKLSICQK